MWPASIGTGTHVRDPDAHRHDVLSRVMHVEEHFRPSERSAEAAM
jgi:hypothetical protein